MNKLVIFAALLVAFVAVTQAAPQTQSPGGCPPIANGDYAITIFQCFEDTDCKDLEAICCPNGAGRYCYNARLGKMTN